MLNVYITIDVEVWTDKWKLDDTSLKQAYDTYMLGITPKGSYGLPYQLDVFNSAGLTTVCFVEPLFSKTLGCNYLRQTIDICKKGNNEVQLHAHPEWIKNGKHSFFDMDFSNRYLLSEFSCDEQFLIIKEAKELLETESGEAVTAFRAGSFAANADTLKALSSNKIYIDSSYNPSMQMKGNGLAPSDYLLNQGSFKQSNVHEIPMTVYRTAGGKLRHTQLTACTIREFKKLLNLAYDQGDSDFVILSHSVELLGSQRKSPDYTMVDKIHQLAEFLATNNTKFNVIGLKDFTSINKNKGNIINLNALDSVERKFQQVLRRKYK